MYIDRCFRASSGAGSCRKAAALTLLSTLVFVLAVKAKAADAVISGRVLDPQGRAVPQAKIRLVPEPGTAFAREMKTGGDQAGSFVMKLEQPGSYRIHADAPGFTPLASALGKNDPFLLAKSDPH